jgi:hypothetical protein
MRLNRAILPHARSLSVRFATLEQRSLMLSGQWNEEDYDVLANGEVVGRIFKANAAPAGSPWMWTFVFCLPAPHANLRLRRNP